MSPPKTIVVADDSPACLDLFDAILQRADCRSIRAEDGAAALKAVHEHSPDLIYLDIQMPQLSGAEVCRLLKADPQRSSIPVVLVSGAEGAETAARCGADLFLPKPVDEPTLLRTLERFLGLRARWELRGSIDVPITFWREGRSHNGRLRDLSRTGFLLESDTGEDVGSRLAIRVELPVSAGEDVRSLTGEAMVVRREPDRPGRMGCRFLRTTAAARATIAALLEAS
jgi:two-component system cell cycle response regulator DivK